MGYTTDLIGHIEIHPPLNEAEQDYLSAFHQSRRYDRTGGPYEVPGNPAAEVDLPPQSIDRYNRVATGQPSLWCGWQPSLDGACLAWDGREKFYAATEWLTYLIDHFLAPHANATNAELPSSADFTFDHTLKGVVAACRRDTHELYLIRALDNVVFEESLCAPVWDFPSDVRLPYEEVIDSENAQRERPRPRLQTKH